LFSHINADARLDVAGPENVADSRCAPASCLDRISIAERTFKANLKFSGGRVPTDYLNMLISVDPI
jgi:hypothetical protein